jgi:VWFA-related protein
LNPRLAALTIVPLVGLTAAAQQSTFRVETPSVSLDVSVRRDGKPVTGLTARDFRLTDRGVLQTIADVNQERLPIDVTFIPDIAGMVEGPWLDGFRRAFATLQRSLRDGDRARLALFNPRIHEVEGVEFGKVEFRGGRGPTDGGASSLNDAIAVSLVHDTSPDYRRMAILVTDGQDGGSFLDEPELFEVVARTDVTVFVVALTDGTIRVPQRPTNERMLQQLADATGGALTIVQRDADLGASFVRELENFRTSYVLRYTPTGVEARGWHDVDVGLNRTGRLEVRARKGYFGESQLERRK